MYRDTDVIAGSFARTMTINYASSTLQQYWNRYAAVSSRRTWHPAPLVLRALADHLPPDVAFAFASKAKAAPIDVRLIAFPHREHSFDQMSGNIGSKLVRSATLQFLARHDVAR